MQRQLCSFAWTYGIDQYQASDNGQQAGAQVVGKGLSTQASKMTDSAYADHPGNNRGDDQGDDDHFKALEGKVFPKRRSGERIHLTAFHLLRREATQ